MEPTVEKFSERYHDVKIVGINIDESPEIAQQYDVMSIPYFALFEDGKVTRHMVGSAPLTRLATAIMGENANGS